MSIEDIFPLSLRGSGDIMTLEAFEFLFSRGSPTVGIYEVISGRVRLTRLNATGQEVCLYVAGDREMLAEASLFSDVYHCDAVAVTRSLIRKYPKPLLLSEFERNPDFAKAYAAVLARELMATRTRNELLRLHTARDRIWHFLQLNAEKDTHAVEVKGPLKDLAPELGMTHEVLYRTLARMADSGEIERHENVIRLLLQR